MYYLENTTCPPEPTAVCTCHVCGDPVYEWDKVEDWATGWYVHPECRPEEPEE